MTRDEVAAIIEMIPKGLDPDTFLWELANRTTDLVRNSAQSAENQERTCQENRHVADNATREWIGLAEAEIFEHEWWDEETAFHVDKYLKEKNT
jgi:hypothetical protein